MDKCAAYRVSKTIKMIYVESVFLVKNTEGEFKKEALAGTLQTFGLETRLDIYYCSTCYLIYGPNKHVSQ
jgi:hypothetical protein